jgi:hypothetical protein
LTSVKLDAVKEAASVGASAYGRIIQHANVKLIVSIRTISIHGTTALSEKVLVWEIWFFCTDTPPVLGESNTLAGLPMNILRLGRRV